MGVITVFVEVSPGATPIRVRLTDSAPLKVILPELAARLKGMSSTSEIYLKLATEKTLFECGVKDGDTLAVFEQKPIVEILEGP